ATATRVTATLITPLSDALSMPPLLGSGAIGATEPWRGRERPWPTARPTDPLSNKHRKRFALSACAGRAANCYSYCGGGRVAKPRLPQAQRASPIRTVTFMSIYERPLGLAFQRSPQPASAHLPASPPRLAPLDDRGGTCWLW